MRQAPKIRLRVVGSWRGRCPLVVSAPSFFWNPYAKVDVDSEDEGLVPVVGVHEIEGLSQEVRGEGYSRMIDLVRSVV